MSTKYDVQYLRQRALRHLTSVFPTTLAEWDQRYNSTLEVFTERPLLVVLLARETNLSELLPAALFSCSWVTDINDILAGVTSSVDGSHVELCWEDKKACLRARPRLLAVQRTRIFGFLLGNVTTDCQSSGSCDSGRLKWLRHREQKLAGGAIPQHPFVAKFKWDGFGKDVCHSCLTASQSSFDSARQALWDDLPSFFDLPSWDEIRRSVE